MTNMTTNAILRSKGLYEDVIWMIGDFLHGTRDNYKRIYRQCIGRDMERKVLMDYCFLDMRLTKNCRYIFSQFNRYTESNSISYNKYVRLNRHTAPAHMELFTRQVAKHKALINQSKLTHERLGKTTERKELELIRNYNINEKFYNKFIFNPDYFEGTVYILSRPAKHIPYFVAPPFAFQVNYREVVQKIKDNHKIKMEKIRRKENTKPFGAGYIIEENEFIQIKVIKERNNKLNCLITAKGVTCGHITCNSIYEQHKVKTKKITYPIKIGEDGVRFIRFMPPIQNCSDNLNWGSQRPRMERREDMWRSGHVGETRQSRERE